MKNQTLVYAQFLTDGNGKFTGEASFPINFGVEMTDILSPILTISGDPADSIEKQLHGTICLYSHVYAQDFPKEEFNRRYKEKHDEFCAKFNLSV